MKFILLIASLFFSLGIVLSYNKPETAEEGGKESILQELRNLEQDVETIEQTTPKEYEISVSFE